MLSLQSENLLHHCHATTNACSAERAYIWKSLAAGVQTYYRCHKQPEVFIPFEACIRPREILSRLLYDSTDSCLSPTKSHTCHLTSHDQAQGATCDMTMLHLTKQHLWTYVINYGSPVSWSFGRPSSHHHIISPSPPPCLQVWINSCLQQHLHRWDIVPYPCPAQGSATVHTKAVDPGPLWQEQAEDLCGMVGGGQWQNRKVLGEVGIELHFGDAIINIRLALQQGTNQSDSAS